MTECLSGTRDCFGQASSSQRRCETGTDVICCAGEDVEGQQVTRLGPPSLLFGLVAPADSEPC